MKQIRLKSMMIALLAVNLAVAAQGYPDASTLRSELLNAASDVIFVAANGGDAHGCAANSREAVAKTIEKHAQMVLITLRRHDGKVMLDDVGERFPLTDALKLCKGRILVAIKDPGNYLKEIEEAAHRTGTESQIVLYGVDAPAGGFMYIPVIDLGSKNALERLRASLAGHPAAVELDFSDDSNPLLGKAIAMVKDGGSRVMFNTSKRGVCGTYVDPSSPVQDTKLVYDPLFAMGGSVILSGGIKPLLNLLHPGSVPILPRGAVPKKVEMPTTYAEAVNQPDSVIAVTQVFGDGIKLTGVALEYGKAITKEELGDATFGVAGRTVTGVTLSDEISMTANADAGRYIIIHLSPADKDASLNVAFGGPKPGQGGKMQTAPQSTPNGTPPITIEKEPFRKAFAEVTMPSGQIVTTERQVNLIVDEFRQAVYRDAVTGKTIDYNIYVPAGIDTLGRVPLVLFIEDASCVGPYVKTPLMQGLGAVIWASPEEQAKRPCIVVTPQFDEVMVGNGGYTSPLVDATARMIEELSKEYPVDTDRLYATGQSMGGMISMVLMIRYPHLFASAYLVACQWVIDQTAPMGEYSYWQMVSANDFRAFPWQNQIMEGLEKRGVKVARGLWDAKWDANMWDFVFDQITSEDAQIYYTVFAPGTVFTPGEVQTIASGHMDTWRYAYSIEPIRRWLFTHTRRQE